MYLDWRLVGLTRGVRARIALGALVGLLAVPIAMWRLALAGQAMAGVIQGAALASLVGVLLVVAVLVLLRSALQYARDEIANGTAARLKVRVRTLLYDHVLRLGPAYFDQRRTGDVLLALGEGVEQLDIFFGQYLVQLVVAGLTPLLIFGFMAFLDLQIALVFVVFALLTLALPAAFHRWNSSASVGFRRSQVAMGADFLDSIQGLATLKAFGQSRSRGLQLAERARDLYRRTMWVLMVNTSTGGVTLLAISAGAAVALAVGAVRVQQGTLPLSTLLVVLLLGVEVFRPLRELVQLYHGSMLALAATRGIYQILDAVPEIVESPSANWTLTSAHAAKNAVSATIRFEDVTFGYEGGRRPAVRNCSFEVRPGETVGVVGPSGAGKSTLVNLLLRLVDPQVGRVLVGGHDVRELPLDLLRRQVAVVAQETYLFYGSVADNLRLGKPEATQAELETAARLANAHDFIQALPRGYETPIGERGTRLSGGQRQRIAIARALLRDAPILVLDEALSSVDAENEAAIQEALERLQRGRTTLVIAHRLSSVVRAHRILVLERGSLVESGTHADLSGRPGGVYARLMAAQQPVEEDRAQDAGLAAAMLEPPREPRVTELNDGTAPGGQAADGKAGDVDGGRTNDLRTTDGNAVDGRANGGRVDFRRDGAVPGAEAPAPPTSLSNIWGRLLKLVRPWWWETLLTLLLGPLHATATVLLGVASALLVARAATGPGDLTPLLWVLGVLVALAAVLRWLDSWISHDLAYRLLAELRIKLYWLLDPLAPAYLQGRRSGDLVSTSVSDVELIELFYAHTISPLFVAVLVPGSVLLVLAWLEPLLAGVLLPFLLGVALTPLLAHRWSERAGAALRGATGTLHAHVVDGVQGLRTIVAFTYGPRRLAEVESASRELSDLKCQFLRSQSLQNASVEALMGLGGLAVLTAGAGLVAGGQLPRTLLPLATVLAASSFQPVVTIVTVAKELMQTVASARRLFIIEDEPVSVLDGPGVHLPRGAGAGRHVVFDNVTFAYGRGVALEQPALQNVSFEVQAGQTVAIVGRSGAGKTTAAHLLLRFWDPQSGGVLIDGRDLRTFQLDELRQQVALVAQDTYLFNASLRENIRLGNPAADDAQVFEAARRANVDEFVSTLPDGYDTLVGERGMQLSGGQRQRVAIARALLKDAPILVLDEATSHLDAVSEAEVRVALEQLMVGRTTLVIAHRLSTVRSADNIVVLDDGRVREQGRHADLLALDGMYAHLVGRQLAVQAATT